MVDEESELLGTVTREELNRKVGGVGYDPKFLPVEPEINTNNTQRSKDS